VFGWNPIFQAKGWDKTFAEMTSDEKIGVTHRYKALAKLRSWLEEVEAE